MYLNAPYLWGGKTPFGIDCSGFTQMVYKLNGYKIHRDASQQALEGEPLSFIEESEAGDLAFLTMTKETSFMSESLWTTITSFTQVEKFVLTV